MDSTRCRTVGAVWAVAQGLGTALFPGLSVKMIRRMIGENFENTGDLEAKSAYLRQLRALGVGLAAAGVAKFVLDSVEEDTDAGADDGEPAVDEDDD